MRLYLTSQSRVWRTAHRYLAVAYAHREAMRRLVLEHGTVGLTPGTRDTEWVIAAVGHEWYRRHASTTAHDACRVVSRPGEDFRCGRAARRCISYDDYTGPE